MNGECSSWRQVTSGVPQGSVLGPVLFLIFINDLENGLYNFVFKFADDTKIADIVNSTVDRDLVQRDLEVVEDWSATWQMQFNTAKCKVMHVGHNNKKYYYLMNGHMLDSVLEERDLRILITADLKPSTQCQAAYSTANKVLGMISRTVTYKDRYVLLQLYKSLVRPHLEYSVSAWSPHYSKDKHLLEKIQHRFTRMIPGLKQLPYDLRLRKLGLWSLEERRNRADLLETFRIYKGWSTISFDSVFAVSALSKTRGHSAKIVKNRCCLDIRHHFFSERVINRWNRLDQHIIDCATHNAFKSRTRNEKIGFFTD